MKLKLESLKSEKFDAMNNTQMQAVRGGLVIQTGAGWVERGGENVYSTKDIWYYDDKDQHLISRHYQINGEWWDAP